MITISRNEEGILACVVGRDDPDDEGTQVAWGISEKLRRALIKECKAHLGGRFSDEFDPPILMALDDLEQGLKGEEAEKRYAENGGDEYE